jgi:hypothetical protein
MNGFSDHNNLLSALSNIAQHPKQVGQAAGMNFEPGTLFVPVPGRAVHGASAHARRQALELTSDLFALRVEAA